MAIVDRWLLLRGLNKIECMDCPLKKMAIVERWLLVEVQLYLFTFVYPV